MIEIAFDKSATGIKATVIASFSTEMCAFLRSPMKLLIIRRATVSGSISIMASAMLPATPKNVIGMAMTVGTSVPPVALVLGKGMANAIVHVSMKLVDTIKGTAKSVVLDADLIA